MLIGNVSVINRSPGLFHSGLNYATIYGQSNKSGMMFNSQTHFSKLSARPIGYLPEYAWNPARTLGSMSSFNEITATANSNITAFAIGNPIESSISGSISNTPFQIALVSFFEASLSASGNLTDANMSLLSNIAASITANGTISNADLFVLATILLEANLTAGISLTPAQISAAFFMAADLSAVISTTSQIRITQDIEADIGGADPLSPQGLAQAVWNSMLVNYTDTGSAGKALSTASSGGVDLDALASAVWDKLKTGANGVGTMGELVNFIDEIKNKLDEIHKLQGLDPSNPMTVTETQRTAGTITQNISGDGITTSTVTRV